MLPNVLPVALLIVLSGVLIALLHYSLLIHAIEASTHRRRVVLYSCMTRCETYTINRLLAVPATRLLFALPHA